MVLRFYNWDNPGRETQKVVKIAENLSKRSDEGNMEQEEDKVLIKNTDFAHAS